MNGLVKTAFFRELVKIAYSLDAAPVSVNNDTAGGPPPTPWHKKKIKSVAKLAGIDPIRIAKKGVIKVRKLGRAAGKVADNTAIKVFVNSPKPIQQAITKSVEYAHAPSDAEAGAGWVRPVFTLGSKLVGH
jgi:hypothetical protein